MTAEENSRHSGAVVNKVSCCCLIVFRACAHRWLSTTTVQNESWQAGLQSARCRRRIERDDDEVDVTMLMFVHPRACWHPYPRIRPDVEIFLESGRVGVSNAKTRRGLMGRGPSNEGESGSSDDGETPKYLNNVDMTRLGYSAGMIPTDPDGFKVSEAVPMLKDGPTM